MFRLGFVGGGGGEVFEREGGDGEGEGGEEEGWEGECADGAGGGGGGGGGADGGDEGGEHCGCGVWVVGWCLVVPKQFFYFNLW